MSHFSNQHPDEMNLREIIGQLFILGFQGEMLDPDSTIWEDISMRKLGGVILFDRFLAAKKDSNNIKSKEQLIDLCTNLQNACQDTLLISIDQEGGMVRRLKQKHGFPELPSAQQLDETDNYKTSQFHARRTAQLLAEIGINLNFAPVADVNVNRDCPVIGKIGRSFSADPERVTKHCEIWLDEHHRAGVLSCLKHFPGHGSASLDSHSSFVNISSTWCEDELLPFSSLIAANNPPMVMMGHLFHSRMDNLHPASLSRPTIQGILREKLGFNGVVVTDDMQMKGITSRYGLLDAVVQALASGVDMIILGNNLEYDQHVLEAAIERIVNGIRKKELTEDRVHEAHNRIKLLKNKLS